jgi:hypothetical protein
VPVSHRERHRRGHFGWLCAAVLGANDGILSTASLVLGVAAAGVGNERYDPVAPSAYGIGSEVDGRHSKSSPGPEVSSRGFNKG